MKKFNKALSLILSLSLILGLNLTVIADVEYNSQQVECYITVTDITDYTKPINILVPRRKLTVTNFNLADFGDTLTGLTAVEGVTYLHALVQLHRNLYGDDKVSDNFMLTEDGYTKYFMGQSTANVMYKNGKDIFAYPQMINIHDGDDIQICLYDEGKSQAISTFNKSHISDVAVNEDVSLSLYQHYAYPQDKKAISGAEICDDAGVYITDKAGKVIKTDKNGNFKVSFDKPGTYTVSAMPEINYYGTDKVGQTIVEWIPKEVTTTEKITVQKKLGEKTTHHNINDLTDTVVKNSLALWGDFNNCPTYEGESSTNVITGTNYLLTAENNPDNFTVSDLSGSSAVVLSPGASITIPINCTTAGDWVVYLNGSSFSDTEKASYTVKVGSATARDKVLMSNSLSEGTRDAFTFATGTNNLVISVDTNSPKSLLIDNIVFGENVTQFSNMFSGVLYTYWKFYDEYLDSKDPGYIKQIVDNRTDTTSSFDLTSLEDIVDAYTKTVTKTETILQRVEKTIPAELNPMLSYTTPLVVIEVSGDLMILNPTLTVGESSTAIKFDTKNKDLLQTGYRCFVAAYDSTDKLLSLKVLTNLKDSNNTATLNSITIDHIKIMCWDANMLPYCQTKLVTPPKETAARSLDWNYTMSKTGYKTYTTKPTE